MNFTAYIERQKRLIRDRHTAEVTDRKDAGHISESEKLFSALNSLKGLNTLERIQANSL